MTLSEELTWRGLIKDKTFSDLNWLDKPRTFYLGVDCSADSLTIGNLAVFLLAKRLLDAGWRTVLLVGGATSLIGDPGGKQEERELKSQEEIAANVAGIEAQVRQLFEGKQFQLVNNYDWLKDVQFLSFLRDVGKHFSMTELLQREFITERIGAGGISYAEFSYTLIQGYDFWHLYKTQDVELQIGGSDQWGNMVSGVPLIRKKEGAEVHALSMPLVINKTTGQKFGKSEAGAVWLDAAKTSPYQFYQFWLNVDDEGVLDYLKIYTLLPKEEIERIVSEFNENRSQRVAQKTLAYEVTKLVHGEEQANAVRRASEVLFGAADFLALTDTEIAILKQELPVVRIEAGLVQAIAQAGLASSNSEALRFIKAGAITLNGKKVTSTEASFKKGSNLLKRGKNNFAVIEN